MTAAHPLAKDPADWSAVIAVFFLALVWHRLGVPSQIYFDEVHYVPAARKLLGWHSANPEHPLLGKQFIAAAIALLGDKPLYWRVPSALFGAFGLFAFSRALWFASASRFATLAGTLLLATSFAWFIQSRIAMLDMIMAGFTMIALWMLAGAVRTPPQARWRLAIAGICMGLALGTKWSVAAIVVLPGLTFLAMRLHSDRARFLTATASGPIPGISLIEAALWLGLVPLCTYWATFWPAFFYEKGAIDPLGFVQHHRYMLRLQDSVVKPHPYMSQWYQWLIDWRAVWYLYKPIDGAQRGIVLIGNPFTMLAALPALGWALWAGIWRKRRDALAFSLLFVVSLAMWPLSGKPIQFYYHYLLPGSFLMACLALALDDLWQRGQRWLPLGAVVLAAGIFVWFYPIISAAKLHNGRPSFEHWMWVKGWR